MKRANDDGWGRKNELRSIHGPSYRGLNGPGARKTRKGALMNCGKPRLQNAGESPGRSGGGIVRTWDIHRKVGEMNFHNRCVRLLRKRLRTHEVAGFRPSGCSSGPQSILPPFSGQPRVAMSGLNCSVMSVSCNLN